MLSALCYIPLVVHASACTSSEHAASDHHSTTMTRYKYSQMSVHCLMQALQVLYSEREVGGEVSLPRHWMRDFFLASLCLEVQENQEALSRLQVWIYLHHPHQLNLQKCTVQHCLSA